MKIKAEGTRAMERSRLFYLVADGLGDRPVAQLGGRTPLEAAATPALDRLAAEGITGLVDPFAPGVRVGTDVGHLCLLGYDPTAVYTGRGPIEAVGAGLNLEAGDVAFRCNFATVDESWRIVDRRAGRIREGTAELAQVLHGMELSGGVTALFKEATEHRAVLVLRGSELSPDVTDSDPGPNGEDRKVQTVRDTISDPSAECTAAERTAALVNEFLTKAYRLLSAHPLNRRRVEKGLPPANMVLTRGAGIMPELRKVTETYGLRGAVVAAEDTVLAIGRMAGLDALTNCRMTANLDTDISEKAQVALSLLADHDLVLVHVKGPDLAGHDNQPLNKVAIIEKIDRLAALVLDGAPAGTLFAVASDHSTPCEYRDHSADPVPVLLRGPGVRSDGVERFGERACAAGGLGRLRGREFFLTMMDLLGVTPKYGS